MKKVFLAAVCCMSVMAAQAREVTYNVYYNEITNKRGELYQYSERYLGTTDVILADSHFYELDKVKMVVEDPQNGATSANGQAKKTPNTSVKEQLPLSEETLMATNLAKKAECVAKQIYRIRETRMNILAGDVEHAPADGKAMQLVLDELNKQESTLTSMFVGKSEVKNLRQSVSVNISDTAKTIQIPLLTFSQKKGPQGAEAEGDAVMLNVKRTTEQVLQPNAKKKNKYEEKIISSKTTITYQNKTIYEKTCNL